MNTESVATGRGVVRWLRVALVLVVVLGVGGLLLLGYALGHFAGGRFGLSLSVFAFGALGLAGGWLAVSKDWGTARKRTALSLGIIGALLGVVVAREAPPTPGRLREEISKLAGPGWQLSKDDEDINLACFDECTNVTREYRVQADVASVFAELQPRLAAHRCTPPGPPPAPDHGSWTCEPADDITIRVDVSGGPNAAFVSVNAEVR